MRRLLALIAFLIFASSLSAQAPTGPIKPPPGKETRKLPNNPTPEAPPIPVSDLIRRFVANEDNLLHLYLRSNFRRTIRIVEYGEDNSPVGEFLARTETTTTTDGKRSMKVLDAPTRTLKRTDVVFNDIDLLVRVPPFLLTSDQLDRYEVTYQGPQPLDELRAYVFHVRPKKVERQRAVFEGLVWVEDRDYAIVKMYGQMVLETGKIAPDLPFGVYELFRENVRDAIWMPSFVRADDYQQVGKLSLPIRLTVRYSDYRIPPAPPASPTSNPPNPAKPPEVP